MACKVGSFTVPSGTGNQSVSGLGFTPKAVLFFGIRLSADGPTNTVAASTPFFGLAVNASNRIVITESDDFTSLIDTALDATKCLKHITGATTSFAADFVSMDADGFTVNFTTANATAYVVNYLALNDAASLISLTTPTGTGNQAYTGVGFKPDAVLLISAPNATLDSWSIGFAVSTTQRGTNTFGYNGATFSIYQRTDRAYANVNGDTVQTQADLVSFNADGFTLNWDTANAATHTVYALCLKGGQYSVGNFTQRTSTGSQGYTGTGFLPTGVLMLSRGQTAAATPNSTFGLTVMMGAASGAGAQAVASYGSGSNVFSEMDRAAVYTNRNDDSTPTLNAKAALTSFDANGFTLNYTTADATAREVIYLAFGAVITDTSIKSRPARRPHPFKPMGDAFRKGKFKGWR